MKHYRTPMSCVIGTILILYLALLANPTLNAKTLQQMQDLYKNIGNDLMYIRKEFTAAQPKVYSILDRVDKMYNLAKVTAEKKHNLNALLKNQSSETTKLYAEINTLKSKFAATEEELITTRKKLTHANNALEKEKANMSQLSQEKMHSPAQQSEINKISPHANPDKKQPEPGDLMHEIRSLKGLSEEEKNLLKQAQSLSLSSTSAPSSPR
ncbi:MAG: hypothetical protein V1646_00400 [bacterium]